MKLELISPDKLHVSKLNMRYGQTPDVSDILPTVRARGIIQPLVVRPEGDGFGIVAGSRRFRAAALVAGETGTAEPVPCAIMDDGDDAAAIEASLIENTARLDPDEVTQWTTFTRLIVREGRSVEDIADTFGLPLLAVRRILALGKLLPRIRSLYRRGEIDAATVRQLTLASRDQQKDWLALRDDPAAQAPTGHALKAWLFGGASIPVRHALFDLADYKGAVVTDLFGDEAYFADADAFWAAQGAAIDAKKASYLDAGWREVVVLPVGRYFETDEHERAPREQGGRVYVAVTARGEVTFHEGWLTKKEAKRLANGEAPAAAKAARPELTSALAAYVDLHRHAAVRAALLDHPGTALRLLVAHAIVGSPLWRVEVERQHAQSDAVAESLRACPSEAAFDARRREVLARLGRPTDAATVAGGNRRRRQPRRPSPDRRLRGAAGAPRQGGAGGGRRGDRRDVARRQRRRRGSRLGGRRQDGRGMGRRRRLPLACPRPRGLGGDGRRAGRRGGGDRQRRRQGRGLEGHRARLPRRQQWT